MMNVRTAHLKHDLERRTPLNGTITLTRDQGDAVLVLLEIAELARQIREDIVMGIGPRTSTVNGIREALKRLDA